MSEKNNKPENKTPKSPRVPDADYKAKKREENRTRLQEMMTAFIGKASDSEIYSLMEYVEAKEMYISKYNSANRDDRDLRNEIMSERFSRVRTMVIKTENVAKIMAALPVVDAVLGDTVGMMERFVNTKHANLDDTMEQMKSVDGFKKILEEAETKLAPLIDIACEKNLVRDRNIKDEYRLRKAVVTEMKKHGIDPESPDAQKQYAEIQAKAAAQLDAEREAKALLRNQNLAAEALNKKLKEQLGIDLTGKAGSNALRAAKEEMVGYGIDPTSENAVADLLKKRDEKPSEKTPTTPKKKSEEPKSSDEEVAK